MVLSLIIKKNNLTILFSKTITTFDYILVKVTFSITHVKNDSTT